jgi:hypothetical protein
MGFSISDLDGEGLREVLSTKTYTSISQEHALNEFNTDDWPPGPVIWQARLTPPLGSSQRLTGHMVHVILIIITEYRMQP